MSDVTARSNLELLIQLRLCANGFGDTGRLLSAILAGRFYAEAPTNPGFVATQTPSGPVIAVYTSDVLLSRHVGACRWFATSGRDLVSLAPVGHSYVIDPGSRHQLKFDPAWVLAVHADGPAA